MTRFLVDTNVLLLYIRQDTRSQKARKSEETRKSVHKLMKKYREYIKRF